MCSLVTRCNAKTIPLLQPFDAARMPTYKPRECLRLEDKKHRAEGREHREAISKVGIRLKGGSPKDNCGFQNPKFELCLFSMLHALCLERSAANAKKCEMIHE